MNPKRGEIILVDFGSGYGGHRQIGVRPAISIRCVAELVIVIPLTSNIRASRFRGTLTLRPNGKNNLSEPSVALVFQMQPIDKFEIVKRIGVLHRADKAKLNEAMRELLVL
jgi:mRNA-degrading endonuclease toxin of MazEF toxin-antitoxin module